MQDQCAVLYTLLSCGVYLINNDDTINLYVLNTILHSMDYEAVCWPSPPQLVLKDVSAKQRISPPWTEYSMVEARKAMEQAIMENKITNKEVEIKLEQTGWIIKNKEGRVELQPRTLIQHENMIIKLTNKYKRCKLCNMLAIDEYHEECKLKIKSF